MNHISTELQTRLATLAKVDRIWIDSLQREIKALRIELAACQRLMLLGGDITVLGHAAHITSAVTWPDGPPYGLTTEQVAEMIP